MTISIINIILICLGFIAITSLIYENKYDEAFQSIRKLALLILFAFSLSALTLVMGLSHLSHAEPCTLCKLQRIIYLMIAMITLSGIILGKSFGALLCSAVLSILSIFVAGYHFGIQQGIFTDPCIVKVPLDLQSFASDLFNKTSSCSRVSLMFFKIPVTYWNMVLSGLCFAISCLPFAYRILPIKFSIPKK